MHACGQGYNGIEKFCILMNLPRPITQNSYDKIANTITKSVKEVAKDTSDAAQEIQETTNPEDDGIVNTSVSNDGSWQCRGFASLTKSTINHLQNYFGIYSHLQ